MLSSKAGASLVTVTSQVTVKPPSSVFAVIVAVPSATAVTTPLSTVATASSELLQDTDVTAAVPGVTVAVSVPVVPIFNANVVGLTVTPVTDTLSTSSSSEQAVIPNESKAVIKANNTNLNFFIFFCFKYELINEYSEFSEESTTRLLQFIIVVGRLVKEVGTFQ